MMENDARSAGGPSPPRARAIRAAITGASPGQDKRQVWLFRRQGGARWRKVAMELRAGVAFSGKEQALPS
jgi:hypothetical protein